jgi:hypothetical protein
VNESAAVNDVGLELLQPRPGEDVCEIGFGPGPTLERLAAADAHVSGWRSPSSASTRSPPRAKPRSGSTMQAWERLGRAPPTTVWLKGTAA